MHDCLFLNVMVQTSAYDHDGQLC